MTTYMELALEMFRSGRYVDPKAQTTTATSAIRAGEYYYAVLDLGEAAAENHVPLEPSHRQAVDSIIMGDADADDLEDFKLALDQIDKNSAAA